MNDDTRIPLWYQSLLCSHCKRWFHFRYPRLQPVGSLSLPFQCLCLWRVSAEVEPLLILHMRNSLQWTLSWRLVPRPAFQTHQQHSKWVCPTDLNLTGICCSTYIKRKVQKKYIEIITLKCGKRFLMQEDHRSNIQNWRYKTMQIL